LATLANMSMSLEHLHPYAAHRLVKLFEIISKRYQRLLARRDKAILACTLVQGLRQNQNPENNNNNTNSNNNNNNNNIQINSNDIQNNNNNNNIQTNNKSFESRENENDDERDTSVLPPLLEEELNKNISAAEWSMQLVLEILNSVLTNALRKNAQLSYALLQQRAIFEPYLSHPRFKPLLHNIEAVLNHFEFLLRQTGVTEWTTDIILHVIERGSMTWQPREYPLQFMYEEEENSNNFFTPYVWHTIRRKTSTFDWKEKYMKLFQSNDETAEDEAEGNNHLIYKAEKTHN